MTGVVTVQWEPGDAEKRLAEGAQALRSGRSLFKMLAGTLEAETEANFAAQGRPSWVPLSAATRRERLQRNRGSSLLKILQDRGILAASVSTAYGEDFSLVGAGGAARAYAGIQQFGGVIEQPAFSVKTRLRTDKDGNLLRQGDTGRKKNLAVFAKDSHKRVKESWHTVAAHRIEIPARPYLPFSGPADAPVLQPAAERSILDTFEAYLQRSLR